MPDSRSRPRGEGQGSKRFSTNLRSLARKRRCHPRRGTVRHRASYPLTPASALGTILDPENETSILALLGNSECFPISRAVMGRAVNAASGRPHQACKREQVAALARSSVKKSTEAGAREPDAARYVIVGSAGRGWSCVRPQFTGPRRGRRRGLVGRASWRTAAHVLAIDGEGATAGWAWAHSKPE